MPSSAHTSITHRALDSGRKGDTMTSEPGPWDDANCHAEQEARAPERTDEGEGDYSYFSARGEVLRLAREWIAALDAYTAAAAARKLAGTMYDPATGRVAAELGPLAVASTDADRALRAAARALVAFDSVAQ